MYPLAVFKKFKGIDNFNDPVSVMPTGEGTYIVAASNADIDNEGWVHRRDGYTATALTGNYHSLWSNETATVCLAVKSSTLYKITKPAAVYAATALVMNLAVNAPMVFEEAYDRIFYTNGSQIGYIKNDAGYSFSDPSQNHKAVLPAGHLLAWYNARLYAAKDNLLYFSDPAYPTCYDTRIPYKQFNSRITMVKPAADGLWVAAGQIYFLQGLDPAEFTRIKRADYDAIEGAAVLVDTSAVGDKSAQGKVVIFDTKEGVCIGGDGGSFVNLSRERYSMPSSNRGTAIYRQWKGTNQVLFILYSN